jgi:diguanylate cyclase (GGDEF)-like protein/PAS domain S-box-containing protein
VTEEVFARAAIGMALVDPASGRFARVNPALTAMLGRTQAELLATTPYALTHPDDRDASEAAFRRLRGDPGETWRTERRFLRPDGSQLWTLLTIALVADGDGPLFLCQVQDVSEHRHARAEREAIEDRLGAVLAHAPVSFTVLEPDGTISLARGAQPTGLEGPLEETVGRSVFEVYPTPEAMESARRALAGQAVMGTYVLGEATYDVHYAPLRNSGGVPAGAIAVATDVSERERALRRLEREAAMQEAVARLGLLALDALDLDEVTAEAVAALSDVLGVELVGLLRLAPEGRTLRLGVGVGWERDMLGVATLPADERDSPFALALAGGHPVAIDLEDADPACVWARLLTDRGGRAGVGAPVGDPDDPVGVLVAGTRERRAFGPAELHFVQAMANVIGSAIQRRQAEDVVRHHSLHDALTGLPNRTLLADRLEQAVVAARREARMVGLLVLDLDDFKDINDGLGHDAGDLVLKALAERLGTALREGDTIARLGGDEFAVLVASLHSPEEAELVAGKVLGVLERPVELDGLPLHLRASIGIAVAPLHGNDMGGLLRSADVAMYRAKRSGSGHAVYDCTADASSLRYLAAVGELRRAIEEEQLTLHFQPVLSLGSGKVTGVEALVRWRHPVHGVLPPQVFIPLAERTGLVTPLTGRVLALALPQIRRWREAGRDFNVAVNLSPRTLHDPELLPTVTGMLAEHDVTPDRLVFEITESAVMADAETATRSMARLDALGVALAIDDFGTGYSSLAYLQRLPVDALKIDRSFVHDVAAKERRAEVIVRSVVELAHSLDLGVVAEGTESEGILERVRVLGCDYAQGDHICPALPPAELTAWLDEREAALPSLPA